MPAVEVPPSLGWWRLQPGGAGWLDRLPRLAAECAERWSLRLGELFVGGNLALVVSVELADGTPAVLKLHFPEPESEHEGDALVLWNGEGAVRLLGQDPERRALLLERCLPGTPLSAVPDDEEATSIGAAVLRRIWRAPPREHGFTLLAEAAEGWAIHLVQAWTTLGKPFERALLEEAVSAMHELGSSQGTPVVLHQDFHAGNVLRSTREPWLAIDPKPLVGEREFDAASLLRNRRWLLAGPDAPSLIRRRLDLLTTELVLDRERMRRWGIAHALAWGVSGTAGKVEGDMLACARLLSGLAA